MANKFGFGHTIRYLSKKVKIKANGANVTSKIALFNKFYNSLCGVDLVGRWVSNYCSATVNNDKNLKIVWTTNECDG